VFVLRIPLERIRSHYEHRVAIGAERRPIERALLEDPIYVDYSRYACQIDQYLEYFPRSRLLVMTAEALRNDRSRSMRTLYEFLGVDPQFVPTTIEREFYRTGERRTHPPVLWSARRLLKRSVPKSKQAKEFVDSFVLRRRPETDAAKVRAGSDHQVIPQSVQHAIGALLREDLIRLRRILGDGFHCWGLDSTQSTRGGLNV
jgi:hypothetical protein